MKKVKNARQENDEEAELSVFVIQTSFRTVLPLRTVLDYRRTSEEVEERSLKRGLAPLNLSNSNRVVLHPFRPWHFRLQTFAFKLLWYKTSFQSLDYKVLGLQCLGYKGLQSLVLEPFKLNVS